MPDDTFGQTDAPSELGDVADSKAYASGTRSGGSQDDNLQEVILDCQRVFDGRLAKIDLLEVRGPDGILRKREVFRHPGAVCMIVLNEDESQILLERQYRVALDRVVIEIPAGKIDAGEVPYDAAVRELREETGFVANSIEHLLDMATAIGYSDEIIHFYLMKGLSRSDTHLDDGEFIETFWMDVDEFKQMAIENKLVDSKTIVAAYLL